MNDTLTFILSALIVGSVIGIVIVYIRSWHKLVRNRREASRFQRDPRAGDLAGYPVFGRRWFVGTVTNRKMTDLGNRIWEVEVEITTYSATGPTTIRTWRPVADLTWFPPSTQTGQLEGKPEA